MPIMMIGKIKIGNKETVYRAADKEILHGDYKSGVSGMKLYRNLSPQFPQSLRRRSCHWIWQSPALPGPPTFQCSLRNCFNLLLFYLVLWHNSSGFLWLRMSSNLSSLSLLFYWALKILWVPFQSTLIKRVVILSLVDGLACRTRCCFSRWYILRCLFISLVCCRNYKSILSPEVYFCFVTNSLL